MFLLPFDIYNADADDIQAELDNDEEDEEFSKDWGPVQMMNGNISSSKNSRNIPAPTQRCLNLSRVNSLGKTFNIHYQHLVKSYNLLQEKLDKLHF